MTPQHPNGDRPGVLTHQGVVYPWQCDHIGHMNVMWYSSKFDEATWQFFGRIGLSPARMQKENRATAALEQHIKYKAELMPGDLIEIRTTVIEVRDKVLIFEHEMFEPIGDKVAATSLITALHLNAATRKADPLPDDVGAAATALLADAEVPNVSKTNVSKTNVSKTPR